MRNIMRYALGSLKNELKKFVLSKVKWSNVNLVYQPGKTGSTSIYESLLRFDKRAIHVHSLSLNHDTSYTIEKQVFLNLFRRGHVFDSINRIIPIREPISRNYSAFFQNERKMNGQAWDGACFTRDEVFRMYINSDKPDWILNWFDVELNKYFGIDIYDYEFDESKGYVIVRQENVSVLVIRHDVPDEMKEEVISTFLSAQNKFKMLPRANETSRLNKDAIPSLISQTPRSYFERMIKSKYTNHFFSSDIDSLSQKYLTSG